MEIKVTGTVTVAIHGFRLYIINRQTLWAGGGVGVGLGGVVAREAGEPRLSYCTVRLFDVYARTDEQRRGWWRLSAIELGHRGY